MVFALSAIRFGRTRSQASHARRRDGDGPAVDGAAGCAGPACGAGTCDECEGGGLRAAEHAGVRQPDCRPHRRRRRWMDRRSPIRRRAGCCRSVRTRSLERNYRDRLATIAATCRRDRRRALRRSADHPTRPACGRWVAGRGTLASPSRRSAIRRRTAAPSACSPISRRSSSSSSSCS